MSFQDSGRHNPERVRKLPDPVEASMMAWLNNLRSHITEVEPSLLKLFETYAGEALFGRSFIEPNLESLPPNASLLEIGAGSLILSCQLMREGYKVTALEPIGEGFSHFSQLRSIVLRKAQESGPVPRLLAIPAEELTEICQYNFAFSINVMEHVENVGVVIERVVKALLPDGTYRFVCPNYLFPYEPHFDIPILFSKKLTELLFSHRIRTRNIPDPSGTWRSLNWITVPSILRIARGLPEAKVSFRRDLLFSMIIRTVRDPVFSARRSPWIRKLLNLIVGLGLHRLTVAVPVRLQPVIDCSFVRKSNRLEGL